MNATVVRSDVTYVERPRVRLLGVPLHPVTADTVDRVLDEFVDSHSHRQIVTVNVDFLSVARRNARFRDVLERAHLVVPDGAPVLWALRARGSDLPSRITGPDLIRAAVRHSRAHGTRIYFLGGVPGTATRAIAALRHEFGPFEVAGASAPNAGVTSEHDRRIAEEVRETEPDFIFVGFGCPKQDLWIYDHRHILDRSVCVGVGGSFSYLSGAIRRAPEWAQRRGLEWAFRLGAEPRRLARRYLIDDLPVLVRLAIETVNRREAKEGTYGSHDTYRDPH